MKIKSAACLAALLLAGCAARVQSTVTVFHTLPATGGGESIAIVPGDKTKEGSLEFRAYAEKLGHYLQAAGYSVVENPAVSHPRYIAVFNYGIDDGTLVTEAYSVPQFGVVGYSGATTTGTVTTTGGLSTLNATTTGIPQYGVTGYQNGTTTSRVFKRAIVLDIFDRAKFDPKNKDSIRNAEVYDGKLSSAGSCGSMAGVMDPLLEAMFQKFPGDSGKAETVTVKFDGKC